VTPQILGYSAHVHVLQGGVAFGCGDFDSYLSAK